MNDIQKFVKFLIQETNKDAIKWTSGTHIIHPTITTYTYRNNEVYVIVWQGFSNTDFGFQLKDKLVDMDVETKKSLYESVVQNKKREFAIEQKQLINKMVGEITLDPEPPKPPKEPSPWLRGRNILGVAFAGSAGLWFIFHNPGLIVIALGVGFVGCLIKSAIDER